MKLPQKSFEDKRREKRVMKYILLIVLLTALPSIYLTFNIVEKSIFESNAARFVKNEFNFKNTHVINKVFKYKNKKQEINLLMIGQDLSEETIDSIKKRLPKYNLASAKLTVNQGLNAKQQIDFSRVKERILEDVFAMQQENEKAPKPDSTRDALAFFASMPDLTNELKVLYPDITTYSLTKTVINSIDSNRKDTAVVFEGCFSHYNSKKESIKLRKWLKSRIRADSVELNIRIVQK